MQVVCLGEEAEVAMVAWHYGDPLNEQRRLAQGVSNVELSDRDVITVTGEDRLSWLHSLTTAQLDRLAPGESALALILSPHGHVEFELHVIDDGSTTWLITEPGMGEALAAYLDSMQFMLRVEVAQVSGEYAVVWEPVREGDPSVPTWLVPAEYAGVGWTEAGTARGGDAKKYVPSRAHYLVGREVIVPRSDLADRVGEEPAGQWALEAQRVAAGVPRIEHETDHRTLPHEVGWMGAAVHVAKGCYRGQEAVARVHNLGHPPRRLVLLHLDGSENELPVHGDVVFDGDNEVGFVGTAVHHFELGPIATAIVKRSLDPGHELVVKTADGVRIAASPEIIVAALGRGNDDDQ